MSEEIEVTAVTTQEITDQKKEGALEKLSENDNADVILAPE